MKNVLDLVLLTLWMMPIFQVFSAYLTWVIVQRMMTSTLKQGNSIAYHIISSMCSFKWHSHQCRAFLLSEYNPYYAKGSAGAGIGGPHVGRGQSLIHLQKKNNLKNEINLIWIKFSSYKYPC